MKKQKANTITSNKGSEILIPLLSKRENELEFINAVSAQAEDILLLLIVDTQAMPKQFGFTGMEIAEGRKLMDEVKAKLVRKKKKCLDIIQWGDTFTKIDHTAKLRNCKKIILLKQDNLYYQNLLKKLKKEKEYSIEEIKLTPVIEKKK